MALGTQPMMRDWLCFAVVASLLAARALAAIVLTVPSGAAFTFDETYKCFYRNGERTTRITNTVPFLNAFKWNLGKACSAFNWKRSVVSSWFVCLCVCSGGWPGQRFGVESLFGLD